MIFVEHIVPGNIFSSKVRESINDVGVLELGTHVLQQSLANKQRFGVNFINVFTCSFYACRSQKHKKLLELTVFFALLGSGYIKAVRKMLVKLTPGDDQR